jgi:hypothetical protein
MALLFRRGRPQVGAVRALARRAGVTSLVGPGAVPAAGLPIFVDQAQLGERIATAGATQSDRGRFSA